MINTAYMYEKHIEGVIDIRKYSTAQLCQIARDTDDRRLRDLVGDIIMYERG
jgi:hypothetical protein